jgi:poly[(R)-3-hydroxyalkanoate] polymerase subunit PhaE
MKSFDPGNEWLKYWTDNQKSLFQAWAEGKPPPFAVQGEPPPGAEQVGELMRRSMEEWATLAKESWGGKGRFDAESVKALFDPAEWKRAGSHFDLGLEKLTEGPTYATLFDLDKKMLNVQKLWVERARDVERYWEIVQGAWGRALEGFTKQLNDPRGEAIKSGRQMLDLWLAAANSALVEMHRSREFLEAQRRMTRSSTEYRLAEREIAETFCEIHHIPTRTEMDEMQRTVTELRREIRALKREREDAPARVAPRASPPGRKSNARKSRS